MTAPPEGALEAPRFANPGMVDYLVAGCTSAVVLALAVLQVQQMEHWLVLPVWACGTLTGAEVTNWWRRRGRLYSPRVLVALVSCYFFFVTPILHVVLDSWMQYVVPPPDWRPWMGRFAGLNALGLVGYQLVVRRRPRVRTGRTWHVRRKYLVPYAWVGLFVAACAQIAMYLQFGGLRGYVATVPLLGNESAVPVWEFALAEAFPYLALILIALGLDGSRPRARRWLRLAALLGAYFFVALIFGGLRGSRANVVWPLAMAVVMIDLKVRRIPRAAVPIALVTLIVFTYGYAFFKTSGIEGLRAIGRPGNELGVPSAAQPNVEGVLVGDLGRADVQAFLLYRMYRPDTDARPYLGETYVGALTLAVPETLWPSKPATKLKAGTEVQYGRGELGPGERYSSRVYGLAGEALLNFGWPAVPVVLTLFGFVVRRADAVVERWREGGDARLLLAPLLVVGVLLLFIQDSDILVFYLVKNASPPVLLVWLTCRVLSETRTRTARAPITEPALA